MTALSSTDGVQKPRIIELITYFGGQGGCFCFGCPLMSVLQRGRGRLASTEA